VEERKQLFLILHFAKSLSFSLMISTRKYVHNSEGDPKIDIELDVSETIFNP